MRAVFRTTSYLVITELLGLLGFMLAAQYVDGPGRFLPFILAIIVVAGIAWVQAKEKSFRELLYVSVLASIVFVILVQALGHTAVPGLAKDTALLSELNISRAVQLAVLLLIAHVVLLGLARTARSLVKSA
jgi:riboflavin transporter FmnP